MSMYYSMMNAGLTGMGYYPQYTQQALGAAGTLVAGLGGGGTGLGTQPLQPGATTAGLTGLSPQLSPQQAVVAAAGGKWMIPNFTATQIQYMFRRGRLDRKAAKAVRCETCDLTLNSEQQAQQHFSGKSHAKKLKKLTSGSDSTDKAESRSPSESPDPETSSVASSSKASDCEDSTPNADDPKPDSSPGDGDGGGDGDSDTKETTPEGKQNKEDTKESEDKKEPDSKDKETKDKGIKDKDRKDSNRVTSTETESKAKDAVQTIASSVSSTVSDSPSLLTSKSSPSPATPSSVSSSKSSSFTTSSSNRISSSGGSSSSRTITSSYAATSSSTSGIISRSVLPRSAQSMPMKRQTYLAAAAAPPAASLSYASALYQPRLSTTCSPATYYHTSPALGATSGATFPSMSSLTGSMFTMLNPATAFPTAPTPSASSLLGGSLQHTATPGAALQGALRYEAVTMQAEDVASVPQAPTAPTQKLDPVSQAVYDNVMGTMQLNLKRKSTESFQSLSTDASSPSKRSKESVCESECVVERGGGYYCTACGTYVADSQITQHIMGYNHRSNVQSLQSGALQ